MKNILKITSISIGLLLSLYFGYRTGAINPRSITAPFGPSPVESTAREWGLKEVQPSPATHPTPTPEPTPQPAEPLQAVVSVKPQANKHQEYEQATAYSEIYQLVNDYRVSQGQTTLEFDWSLARTAQDRADYLASTGVFKHEYFSAHGYATLASSIYNYCPGGGCTVGENIAKYNVRDYTAIVQAWQGSEGHRANMLRPSFVNTGIGIADDSKGTVYVVQLFGSN